MNNQLCSKFPQDEVRTNNSGRTRATDPQERPQSAFSSSHNLKPSRDENRHTDRVTRPEIAMLLCCAMSCGQPLNITEHVCYDNLPCFFGFASEYLDDRIVKTFKLCPFIFTSLSLD